MAKRMMERLVVKVWEFPVRAIHWTNFLCVVGLIFTGAYIHWPFLRTVEGPAPYLMGWMRLAHLILGWGLMVGLIARWYWSLVGNKFASVKEFFPFFYASRRRDMVGVFKYYAFTSLSLPPHLGHNALASMAYLGVFLLLGFQVLTGFALFGLYDPAGWAHQLTGWVFGFASNGWVRLAHYCLLWVFLAFFINHIYSMWVSDLAEKDGTAGSIFSGYKYGPIEEFEDIDHRPWQSRDERRRTRAGGPH